MLFNISTDELKHSLYLSEQNGFQYKQYYSVNRFTVDKKREKKSDQAKEIQYVIIRIKSEEENKILYINYANLKHFIRSYFGILWIYESNNFVVSSFHQNFFFFFSLVCLIHKNVIYFHSNWNENGFYFFHFCFFVALFGFFVLLLLMMANITNRIEAWKRFDNKLKRKKKEIT